MTNQGNVNLFRKNITEFRFCPVTDGIHPLFHVGREFRKNRPGTTGAKEIH